MSVRIPDEVEAALGLGEFQSCILCGSLTENRGVFEPKDSVAFGGSSEKQRYIIYALCENDSGDVAKLERVERIILGRLAVGF